MRNLNKQEKGISGKGKLTNNMIDRLQNYYGIAIRSNKESLKRLQSATKAALFHVASNKDHKIHYPHCPVCSDRVNTIRTVQIEPPLTNLAQGSQYPLY